MTVYVYGVLNSSYILTVCGVDKTKNKTKQQPDGDLTIMIFPLFLCLIYARGLGCQTNIKSIRFYYYYYYYYMGERVQNWHRKINTGQKPNRPYSPSSSWRIDDIYFSHTYYSYVKPFVLNINSLTSTCMCVRCVFKYISVS